MLISTQMLYFGDVDAIFWVMMQENYFRITDMKSAGISYFFRQTVHMYSTFYIFRQIYRVKFAVRGPSSLQPFTRSGDHLHASVKFSSGTKKPQTNKQKNEHHWPLFLFHISKMHTPWIQYAICLLEARCPKIFHCLLDFKCAKYGWIPHNVVSLVCFLLPWPNQPM